MIVNNMPSSFYLLPYVGEVNFDIFNAFFYRAILVQVFF